jgi:thiosulfate reductase cytochrome b subunit
MKNLTIVTRITQYLLFLITIVFLITGLGITHYQVIGQITIGALTKPLSYQIHTTLTIPFIVLLILHILFSMLKKKIKKN